MGMVDSEHSSGVVDLDGGGAVGGGVEPRARGG